MDTFEEEKIMSHLTISYFSRCLVRGTSFELILPNDYQKQAINKGMKTLFLLHGWSGCAGNWVPEHFAEKYNFAIVMPNGENSFYLNALSTGRNFQSFLGEELVSYVQKTFGLAQKKEDTFIMGLSMGGFGAIHTALAYPHVFGTAIGLSSALIIHKIANMQKDSPDSHANYAYYTDTFGDLTRVLESENNPEVLVKKLQAQNTPLPALYLTCGTEDFLIENNRQFHQFLQERNVSHFYQETSGAHNTEYWDKTVQTIIPLVFGAKA